MVNRPQPTRFPQARENPIAELHMDGRHDSLTGTGGVYFVASRFNALGFQAAPTFGNVPNVDLLVSAHDGSVSISLQVKTAACALRFRGRARERRPHHYEWSMSWKSAKLNQKNLFFAFVDLKEFKELPDVFLVPSGVVHQYYSGGDPSTWRWPRYHIEVEKTEPYKNKWDLVSQGLNP